MKSCELKTNPYYFFKIQTIYKHPKLMHANFETWQQKLSSYIFIYIYIDITWQYFEIVPYIFLNTHTAPLDFVCVFFVNVTHCH